MYASLLRISGALHLGIFEQPASRGFFSDLLVENKPSTSELKASRSVFGVQWEGWGRRVSEPFSAT
jgi:hypothetical protein